jgi:hypothetical protein
MKRYLRLYREYRRKGWCVTAAASAAKRQGRRHAYG